MTTGDPHVDFFWGKAAGVRDGEPGWHPLAYHSLDVAAAAEALLARNPRRLATLARLLETSPDNTRRFIAMLVALHDVGKFSAEFQAKSAEAWAEATGRHLGEWQASPRGVRHDADGFALRHHLPLRSLLSPATADWSAYDFTDLWAAIAGHHGQPISEGGRASAPAGFDERPLCFDAAEAFCRDVRALFDPIETIAPPAPRNLALLSWHLSGLTVIADWIGSNRQWFPYHLPDLRLPDYWPKARIQAETAIANSGLLPSEVPPEVSLKRLMPEIADRLSPLQAHAADLPLPEGPILALIEDVTGAGKTEAALMIAARLMAERRADGLYFALPTMATANAMYDRLSAIYLRLFADGAVPSLILSHGKRQLNQAFSDSILDLKRAGPTYFGEGGATCASWIADDRRKAFLAAVGVGTIDQALLGVLASRHQSMRLWGLADKVLVIDEAHAYDAYMSREMEALVEFHAALGGSAIVLSATLPLKQRGSLAAAFKRGLGEKPSATLVSADASAYPLLTLVGGGQTRAHPMPSRADRKRRLPVRRIGTAEEAVDAVVGMAEKGAAVAWIRNTVDDAIEAVEALEARGLQPVLLHARFAMGDRLDIEKTVREVLGRNAPDLARRGFVVVGTQILEQSLDYDVDGMIVDLAPIDLMIQRAGRLWRHASRDAGRPFPSPELLVLSPDPDAVTEADWYGEVSTRAAAVYAHHGLVWRSAKALFKASLIETPDGVRPLVEAVYGRERGDLDDIPAPLLKASNDAVGKHSAARSVAGASLLDLAAGYGGSQNLWDSDQAIATRLGEPVTTFRLARLEDGAVVPWIPDPHPMRAWALSEVSLARRKADGVPAPNRALSKVIDAAKDQWPEWERDMPLLVLEPEGSGWRGTVALAGKEKPALYDARRGLRLAAT